MEADFSNLKREDYIEQTVARQFSPLKAGIIWKGICNHMKNFGLNYKVDKILLISKGLGKETLYNPKKISELKEELITAIRDKNFVALFYDKGYEVCQNLILKALVVSKNFKGLSNEKLADLLTECHYALMEYGPLAVVCMVADILTFEFLPELLMKYGLSAEQIVSLKKPESVSSEWINFEDVYIQREKDEIGSDIPEINFFQEMTFFRTYRTDSMRKYFYFMLPVYTEIAKRLNVSLEELSCFLNDELIDALNGKILDMQKIKDRKKGFSLLLDNGNLVISNNIYEFAEPEKAGRIKGNCAFPGVVSGTVKIIESLDDLSTFQKGDILVAKHTSPAFTVYFGKAAAIVTNEGGLTSHAAIVSREMKIPCIVGTGNATSALRDGDKVQVNSEKGEVTKL